MGTERGRPNQNPRYGMGGHRDPDRFPRSPAQASHNWRQSPSSREGTPNSSASRPGRHRNLAVHSIKGPETESQDADDSDDSIEGQFDVIDNGTGTSSHAEEGINKEPVTDIEFYSNLVFLSILRPHLGPHRRRPKDLEFVDLDNPTSSSYKPRIELQRDFLDRLCYLASFKKGGDSVTAAAIEFKYQQTGRSITSHGQEQRQQQVAPTQIIWFSANAGVHSDAWAALLEVENLINRNRSEDRDEEFLAQEICEKFTRLASCNDQKRCCNSRLRDKNGPKGTHRINYYARRMNKHGNQVVEWLRTRPAGANWPVDGNGSIANWIKGLGLIKSQLELVIACYSCWYEEPFRSFLKQAKDSSFESDSEFSEDLKEFAHFVARLGAHRYAALKVAAAIKNLPYFGTNRNTYVKFDKLPKQSYQDGLEPTPISLSMDSEDGKVTSYPDPWDIIHKLGQRFQKDGLRLAEGYYLEERGRGEPGFAAYSFRREIQRWLSNRNGVLLTHYHAELQVANFFNANGIPFQDRDRYIGCSKGACWFCYQYLRKLRPSNASSNDDGFAEPSCHNVVLPGVSFPQTRAEASRKMMEEMRNKLNDEVLRKIYDVLMGNIGEFEEHHQSTDTWMDRTVIQPSSWMIEEDIRSVVQS